ncbi:S9 family peptidase [Texcoconibacillus texcoconensis]|uniref:Dipeptidyl aminopeptidase/acylaminoacyl peptidase n=1 Tax=Texcoconibacillus texcoconensis TaxID=1095777 RepID=A0A840QRR0_9BACI|nr:S9 family peptidase [Texcoconibacillus texcoconensis]MBB5174018.1 dipeptidyl aminopeptidase/acylaminoacyl peptidase [Texcoconibacillus texcoconensis]
MSKKRPIETRDLRNIHVINEPQLSPDGTKVAYVQQTINDNDEYEAQLFVQSTDGTENAQKFTYQHQNVQTPRFSPDSKYIAFVANQDDLPQIFLIPLDGGESRAITNAKHGAGQPVWSPDSEQILFTTKLTSGDENISTNEGEEELPDEKAPLIVDRLKYKADPSSTGFLDDKWKQLAVVNIHSEETTVLTNEAANHEPGSWSPDSKQIAYSANKLPDQDDQLISDLYILDVKTKKEVRLTDGQGVFSAPVFSNNGEMIAYFGHELQYAGATLTRLWTVNIATRELSVLNNDWDGQMPDCAIGDMRSGHPNPGPVWSNDDKHIFASVSYKGNTSLYRVSLDREVNAIFSEKGHVYGYSIVPSQNKAVIAFSTPTNPGDLFITPLTNSDRGEQITNVNEDLHHAVSIQAPEEVEFIAEDGWKIHGWLYKPYGFDANNKYPMILDIHGGPHAMFANTFFHQAQRFAASGYVVLMMNPRGSHGYGQSFVDACRGDYGGGDYRDLMASVDQALEQFPFIDSKRLGVTGGSYGGFMTNWMVAHTDRFKAAVTLRSISNWISFYGVSDIGYFFTDWEIGTDLLNDPDRLWKHSPLKYVNNIETPLLIIHGERDFRCPVEQAEQLYVALKHRKKETRFIRFPDSNHELSRSGKPSYRYQRLDYIIDWFDQYL